MDPRKEKVDISGVAQQLLNSPLDGEVAQVRVVLANTDKEHGDIGGMDETDKRADHVTDRVALGDDEAVQGAYGAEGGVEVARLGDRVGANEGLGDVRLVCAWLLEG